MKEVLVNDQGRLAHMAATGDGEMASALFILDPQIFEEDSLSAFSLLNL